VTLADLDYSVIGDLSRPWLFCYRWP